MPATENASGGAITSSSKSGLEDFAAKQAQVWDGSSYYTDAEQWLFLFWRDTHPFAPLFKELDTRHLLELACGHGRHSEYVLNHHGETVQSLVMMDILQSNVDQCKSRIGQRENVQILT